MRRKRLTQIFPWLLPIRKKQRLFCFYLKMRLDGKKYAIEKEDNTYQNLVFEADSTLYNHETGFDMKYQENKVFNLKLAAQTVDDIVIRPGEVFSFWRLVKNADKKIPYKDGLVVINGELTTAYGGGLCQISNLLFWLFLHTPLLIVERHGHSVKDFPDPPGDDPVGIDATVSEGWFDLKVKNTTNTTFQIKLSFDEEKMHGKILADKTFNYTIKIENNAIVYEKAGQDIYQKADVVRFTLDKNSGAVMEQKLLYQNKCKIGYPLPEDNQSIRKEENNMKKIAILFGGCSSEYEVSLQSAYGVIKNIDRSLYESILIGIAKDGRWFLYEGEEDKILNDTWHKDEKVYPTLVSTDKMLKGIYVWKYGFDKQTEQISLDGALPILHGKNGEDGTVQGVFALAGIPVIGCDTLSSAVCMDKDMAHRVVKEAGINVPEAKLLTHTLLENNKEEVLRYGDELGYPLFVKPLRAGSSFGITKVEKSELLFEALTLAFTFDNLVVIERMIEGFEVGCAIMGKEELIVGEVDEIELSEGFFDFTEKYSLKSSKIHVPARISNEDAIRVKETAKKIYQVLGCECFARVDMFFTPDGSIYFNEVNTIPGFTEHSRFPNMMKAAGISMKEVVNHLIELGVDKS